MTRMQAHWQVRVGMPVPVPVAKFNGPLVPVPTRGTASDGHLAASFEPGRLPVGDSGQGWRVDPRPHQGPLAPGRPGVIASLLRLLPTPGLQAKLTVNTCRAAVPAACSGVPREGEKPHGKLEVIVPKLRVPWSPCLVYGQMPT
jgi:hypothetical protein